MITLPDPRRAWDYENGFYLTCDASRMSKLLAHYELFKMTAEIPGAIVECGVFKGTSLARFAMFRQLFGGARSKRIIGFDTFGPFPQTKFARDVGPRASFTREAGEESIDLEQLEHVLRAKKCDDHVVLVAGDICETVPHYVAENPQLKISLLNLDTDVYEPAVTVLEQLWPRLEHGGVLLLDDYGVFPGETQAVDEYFKGRGVKIRKLPFAMTPCHIVKE
jgi:hypothetical protein